MRTSTILACTVVLLLAVLASTTVSAAVDHHRSDLHSGYTVLRVDQTKLTKPQQHALKHITDHKAFHIDRWATNDLMVPPTTLASVRSYLSRHGLKYSTMIDDVGAKIAAEDQRRAAHRARMGTDDVLAYPGGADDFFSEYHSLEDIQTFAQNLVQTYPHIVRSKQIGTSYGGVPIFVYIVTAPSRFPVAPKPAIYLEGGIHAREWIAHATNTYMLNALVTGFANNDTHIVSLLHQLEYHIVPVLNVDGYLYTWSTNRMWRKTTKPNPGSSCIGTDPNRNWDNHWCLPGVGGSTDPCDDSFCGSNAFSEACVKAAADYALANRNIVAFVDFHSYSQLWMTPYGYTINVPSNNAAQTAMSNNAVAALQNVNGVSFAEGNIYTIVYPAAGSSADWAYDNTTHVKFSFGVELRDQGQEGFLLDASQIVPSGNETLAAVLAMGDYLIANPESYELPTPRHHKASPQHATKHKKTTTTTAAKKAEKLVHFGNMKQFAPRSSKQARKHSEKQAKKYSAKKSVAAKHMAALERTPAAPHAHKKNTITPKALKHAKRNLKHVKAHKASN